MNGCLEIAMPGVVRRSLVDQVIEQVREAISSGEWPVGSRIPAEPELIASFGVARNTMREAVRALAHAGVLEVRHGDGTYVRAADETDAALRRWLGLADVSDVLVVRRGLEVEAARQAAERRTPDDLVRLSELHGQSAGADSAARVARALEFHLAVVEASHNPVLVQLYRGIADRTSSSMVVADVDPEVPDMAGEGHAELVTAIRVGDPERAAEVAARHLRPLIESVRRRLRS